MNTRSVWQVAALDSGLRDMRLQSSVSLIGRQRVDAADAAHVNAAMTAASATVRYPFAARETQKFGAQERTIVSTWVPATR